MLTYLTVSDYAIVSRLEMEFHPGMTVITGETGAGKSIMLDALGLCLGDRADPRAVRPGHDRAEVIASFDISQVPAARSWLAAHDLLTNDECILRRVITAEGRSRAYINGSASPLQDCAELGDLLVDIHSQHAHQSLLRREIQRQLLDEFAGSRKLAAELEVLASDWLRGKRELDLLQGAQDEQTARAQLLAYQVQELDELALQPGELETLEQEQQVLANAEHILQTAHQSLELCEAQEAGIHRALQLLADGTHNSKAAGDARELMDSAAIQLGEARSELQRHLDGVEINPERLAEVSQRLEAIYDVARKHRVNPEDVSRVHADLGDELASLADGGKRVEELESQLAQLQLSYTDKATALSDKRRKAGAQLVKKISSQLKALSMAQCRFQVDLRSRDADAPHPHGREDVEFLISTTPGAAPQPLGKIASGGELSRISLAIAVITSSAGTVPSMVFDEVDVGIGGATAEVVGRLLRKLSAGTQVLCVTHLPQVAAQGHQHLQVSKAESKTSVETTLAQLDAPQRVQEVARMLGGIKITDQSLAHAREMIEAVES
jgi:DNA repair protein RecN (Recombination protein N)